MSNHGTKVKGNGEKLDWQTIYNVVQDASNESLLHYIDMTLKDEHLLKLVALRSYRHQLGFLKLVLLVDTIGNCLRVHLWDNESSHLAEDIHSHCAQFHSRIVLGRLVENSFSLVPGSSHTRFRYRFDNKLKHCVAEVDGTTGVSLYGSRTLPAGKIYKKGFMELHNVTKVQAGTLTVSAWKAHEGEAVVLKNIGACPEDCLVHTEMSIEELRETLYKLKNRLTNK